MSDAIISARGRFDPERLDKRYYLLSLASELRRTERITETELTALSDGLYALLEAHLERFTGGESSSVISSTAEKLLRSLMYNCDLTLLQLGEEAAAKRLAEAAKAPERELEKIYFDGLRLNRELQLKARSQLRSIKRELDSVEISHRELLRLPGELERLIRGYDDKYDAACSVSIGYRMPTLGGGMRGISGMLHLMNEIRYELELTKKLLPQTKSAVEALLRIDPDANLGECCLAAAISGEIKKNEGILGLDLRPYRSLTNEGYLERLTRKALPTAQMLAR